MPGDAADEQLTEDLRKQFAEDDPVPAAVIADAYRALQQARRLPAEPEVSGHEPGPDAD